MELLGILSQNISPMTPSVSEHRVRLVLFEGAFVSLGVFPAPPLHLHPLFLERFLLLLEALLNNGSTIQKSLAKVVLALFGDELGLMRVQRLAAKVGEVARQKICLGVHGGD